MGRNSRRWTGVAALAGVLLATPAAAQTNARPTVGLELNRVDQIEAACRFTFLAENGMRTDLAALTVETVIIDVEGLVDRLTLFEFGALPEGTPRVRQFDVPGLDCAQVGRGGPDQRRVRTCGGVEGCAEALTLSSRTGHRPPGVSGCRTVSFHCWDWVGLSSSSCWRCPSSRSA